MTVNNHLITNLEEYLKAPKPEYAFLIDGNWGVGKSFFLAEFIRKYTTVNKYKKIITISLFGFKSTSSIDEAIFKGLHPILGHENTKLAGNILKGALKLGLKVDLGEGTNDKKSININFDFNKTSFFDKSLNKKNAQEIILALDDFERTNIPLKELLGYVNQLVEISNVKVILVADQTKLTSTQYVDESTIATYRNFKEKTIGKTFYVQHDVTEVLNSFLKSIESKTLKNHIEIIKKTHERSEYNNLRLLRQTIEDFNIFSKKIDQKYLKNTEFTDILINLFFSFSLEIKRNCLTQEEFLEKLKNIDTHNKKYSIDNAILYSHDIWREILFNSNCEEVDNATSKLYFFQATEQVTQVKAELPTWKKLIHYNELEDDEFDSLIHQVKESFLSAEEKTLFLFFRELDLLLFFIKLNFIDDIREQLEVHAKTKILEILESETTKQELLNMPEGYDRSGYNFFSRQDPLFIKLFQISINKKEEIIIKDKENLSKLFTTSVTNAFTTMDKEKLEELILNEYKFKPLFHVVPPESFYDMLLKCDNKWQNHLLFLLETRYFSWDTLNNHRPASFMTSEKDFWEKICDLLQSGIASLEGNKIKKYIIQEKTLPLFEKIRQQLN
ncbi:P-loop NTPase fold protein [Kosakonia oryzae]|uniref:KAP family P-loop domain-containing protein n=1 Tax=Kosakonia oryzae TaxID=497725 RepID=A0AA94H429_9ENTR|nr:P-loop NTPase fold protein [Kosakonia oryzae]ANI82337.1 hypothetical protein AWR26_09270 [Kosakonia oryzae]UDJ84258.1 hypothetical protein I5186_09355 [Kosakonia oryzae]SFC54970.1 KAP family P-loop domain-containing protein [Kosakonia oryzae]